LCRHGPDAGTDRIRCAAHGLHLTRWPDRLAEDHAEPIHAEPIHTEPVRVNPSHDDDCRLCHLVDNVDDRDAVQHHYKGSVHATRVNSSFNGGNHNYGCSEQFHPPRVLAGRSDPTFHLVGQGHHSPDHRLT
jgi:hypothetical protein